MITAVVHNSRDRDVAKNRIYEYDLVVFIEQPRVIVAYPLFAPAENALWALKRCAFARYPSVGYSHLWHPYDVTEFIFPLSEEIFLQLLSDFVPNIEIRNWRKPARGQRALVLCFSCKENDNCRICFSK